VRTSVIEISPGIGRWCARLHDRFGIVIVHEFSNLSADDAEDRLLGRIFEAWTSQAAGGQDRATYESVLNDLTGQLKSLRARYGELLGAVRHRFEGETRHETALKYIQEGAASQQFVNDTLDALESGAPGDPE